MRHIAYVNRRCFTASQTAEIINLVIFPAITYVMSVVNFDIQLLKKWDRIANNTMQHKLKQQKFLGCKHWYLQHFYMGYNLFKLEQLQTINHVPNYLNYSANMPDIFASTSSSTNFHKSDIVANMKEILTDLQLDIVENEAYIDPNYAKLPIHYIKSEKIEKDFIDANVQDITQIISNQQQVHNILHLQEVNKLKDWSISDRNKLKQNICENDDITVQSHILKLNNIMPEIKIQEKENKPDQRFEYDIDKDYDGYEVFIDESLKDGKASFGIYYKDKSKYNYCNRVYGEQTLQNATYQGIEHVLQSFPKNKTLII